MTGRPTRLAVIATIAVLACSPQRARAEASGASIIAVDGANDREREAVAAAVATAARTAGWSLASKALTKAQANKLVACTRSSEPWRCAGAAEERPHQFLVVAIEAKPSTSMLILTGKAISTRPEALVVLQRFCDPCSDERLALASTDLTMQLIKELAARTHPTEIKVASVPTGAVVSIDGKVAGATDGTIPTSPGHHRIHIEKPGYEPADLEVDVENGKTLERAVTLRALPRPSRIRPIALVGGGAVLVGLGTFALLDQQDGPNDKYRHSRATPVGLIVGGAGLVAIGTGAYLWWRGTRSPDHPSAPVVSPTAGGLVLGWMGAY